MLSKPGELEIVRADPAGNITVFVLTPVPGREARMAAVRALLADPVLQAEQAGFVLPPAAGTDAWRLEMMGGEFCGNAARSFGLFVARRTGLAGRHTVAIRISGQAESLAVRVDTDSGGAEAELPPPLEEKQIEFEGRRFPVYVFEGITHIIAEDIEPDTELVSRLIRRLAEKGPLSPDALGVMFYDTRRRFMRPAVWVRAAGTTVFESSCGSGSAALGVWAARDARDGEFCFDLAQPGGVIAARVLKQDGVIRRLSIGGPVSLGEPRRWSFRR